jgi:thiol-disulfide isomerase/thioredoxin
MKQLFAVILCCICAALYVGCAGATEPVEVSVGSAVPEFALKTLDGATVKSDSLKGQIVVLNFWATYCPTCRGEIPDLNKFASGTGAKVISIALDQEGAPIVRSFLKETKVDYPVLIGDEETFQRFQGVGIPYTLVLDRSQHVAKIYRGPATVESLEADVKAIEQGLRASN